VRRQLGCAVRRFGLHLLLALSLTDPSRDLAGTLDHRLDETIGVGVRGRVAESGDDIQDDRERFVGVVIDSPQDERTIGRGSTEGLKLRGAAGDQSITQRRQELRLLHLTGPWADAVFDQG